MPIMIDIQRYMCSRFFIDFKTLTEQMLTITKYVATHFLPCSMINELFETNAINDIFRLLNYQHSSSAMSKAIDPLESINARLCLLFFEYLLAVIHQSCVCLAGDDKDILLNNIRTLKECYHVEYEYLFAHDDEHHRKYHTFQSQYVHASHHGNRWVSSFVSHIDRWTLIRKQTDESTNNSIIDVLLVV
jgi:hypothetical protein